MTIWLAFITVDRHQPSEIYNILWILKRWRRTPSIFDSEMEAKDAKWKLIEGLVLMSVYHPEKQSTEFDYLLL